jgi:quercetin dioxygenase-like cupin family protein
MDIPMQSVEQQVNHIPAGVGHSVFVGNTLGIIFKVLSGMTGGSVAVIEHTLAAKALAAPPHRHQYEDEVSYVLEGRIAVLQGDEVTVVGPGSYVVKPRGIFHTFWNPGYETARHIEIIAPGGFENYFTELAPLVPANAPADIPGVLALAQRYGLEFDMSRLPELEQKYGVSLTGVTSYRLG